MNIFKALFGIFKKGGLVATIKKKESIKGFAISALLTAIMGSILYGFSMGIGNGLDTAIKDSIKVTLITLMVIIFSIPVFWISFRLLGREESMGHVNAVPLTMLSTVTLILAISSPVVFLLSVLVTSSSSAIYIHIIIINLAIFVGLYITGMLIYNTFKEHKRLVTPAIISISMMGVILVVGILFFSPFLRPNNSFSEGTDLLKDGIGIDVDTKAVNSLNSAAEAESLTYQYLRTNDNGDTIQDYYVTRVGKDFLIEVNIHTVLGEDEHHNSMIWVLDGETFTDFENNTVNYATDTEVLGYLTASSPQEIFVLPPEFESANWRGDRNNNSYTAIATTANLEKATMVMDKNGRLSSFIIGSGEDSAHSKIEITNIVSANLTKEEIKKSLDEAIKKGSFIGVQDQVDRSLSKATSENQVNYRYQTSYDNNELIQNYTVTRIGDNYQLQIHLHAIPGEILREDNNIWVIDGIFYSDFNDGEVNLTSQEEITSYLESSLPENTFKLSSTYSQAIWEVSQIGNLYKVIGNTQDGSIANLSIDSESGRLSQLSLTNGQATLPAIITVKNIVPITLDLLSLKANLNEAIITGLANDSIPSMTDYARPNDYFLLRYPDTWKANAWNATDKEVEFRQDCPSDEICAGLLITVNQLPSNQSIIESAANLADFYKLQPEFRNISSIESLINDSESGIVKYLFDSVEDGKLVTTQHIVYIFNGDFYQYRLDFNSLANEFTQLDQLFEQMAKLFTYIK